MDIDYSKLDLNDPKVRKLLEVIGYDRKFNKEFVKYCTTAYDWQKRALNMTEDHNITALVSGNRTGKSYTSAALVTMMLTGRYPPWYTGKKFDRPITAMVSSVDSNTNKRIWQNYLLGTPNRRMRKEIGSGMIPKDDIVEESIVTSRGDDVQSMQIKHVSGGYSTLYFTAYSQGREAIQGFSGELIAIDEQPNVPFLQEAITRTKTVGGVVLLSFTPLEGLDYTLEQLLALPPTEDSTDDGYGHKIRSDGKWSMIRASWEDVPHIMEHDPNAIEEARREYGVDFACRVYGIPSAGSGNIFQYKEEEVVFNPNKFIINDNWSQIIGVDFGWTTQDPSAMTKIAWDEYNDIIYVLEEWKGHTPTDKIFVKNINYLDPNISIAWPRDGSRASDWKGGQSYADKLRNEFGLNLLKEPFSNPERGKGKNNHLAPGFQEINDRFATGRLKISSDCKELLTEMKYYHYGKDLNGNSTGKPDKSCHDHSIDSFRYAVMSIIQGYGEKPKQQQHIWSKYQDDDDFHWSVL